MWGNRDPKVVLSPDGTRWGGIEHWGTGLITRGVLLDAARFRHRDFIEPDRPVEGSELEEIARSQGVEIESGDAVLCYGGVDAWRRQNPDWSIFGTAKRPRPAVGASIVGFLREYDVSLWIPDLYDYDFLERYPVPSPLHAAIGSFGLALIDNPLLEPLAQICSDEGRWEFMVVVSPLIVEGGTGSPVNPLVIL